MPMPYDYSQPIILAILGVANAAHNSNFNREPAVLRITGAPPAVVRPAAFYAFTPTVLQGADPKLKFTIENKPAWLSFGRVRGTLYGVPTESDVGTYSKICITVSDGTTVARLEPFTVQVVAPTVAR